MQAPPPVSNSGAAIPAPPTRRPPPVPTHQAPAQPSHRPPRQQPPIPTHQAPAPPVQTGTTGTSTAQNLGAGDPHASGGRVANTQEEPGPTQVAELAARQSVTAPLMPYVVEPPSSGQAPAQPGQRPPRPLPAPPGQTDTTQVAAFAARQSVTAPLTPYVVGPPSSGQAPATTTGTSTVQSLGAGDPHASGGRVGNTQEEPGTTQVAELAARQSVPAPLTPYVDGPPSSVQAPAPPVSTFQAPAQPGQRPRRQQPAPPVSTFQAPAQPGQRPRRQQPAPPVSTFQAPAQPGQRPPRQQPAPPISTYQAPAQPDQRHQRQQPAPPVPAYQAPAQPDHRQPSQEHVPGPDHAFRAGQPQLLVQTPALYAALAQAQRRQRRRAMPQEGPQGGSPHPLDLSHLLEQLQAGPGDVSLHSPKVAARAAARLLARQASGGTGNSEHVLATGGERPPVQHGIRRRQAQTLRADDLGDSTSHAQHSSASSAARLMAQTQVAPSHTQHSSASSGLVTAKPGQRHQSQQPAPPVPTYQAPAKPGQRHQSQQPAPPVPTYQAPAQPAQRHQSQQPAPAQPGQRPRRQQPAPPASTFQAPAQPGQRQPAQQQVPGPDHVSRPEQPQVSVQIPPYNVVFARAARRRSLLAIPQEGPAGGSPHPFDLSHLLEQLQAGPGNVSPHSQVAERAAARLLAGQGSGSNALSAQTGNSAHSLATGCTTPSAQHGPGTSQPQASGVGGSNTSRARRRQTGGGSDQSWPQDKHRQSQDRGTSEGVASNRQRPPLGRPESLVRGSSEQTDPSQQSAQATSQTYGDSYSEWLIQQASFNAACPPFQLKPDEAAFYDKIKADSAARFPGAPEALIREWAEYAILEKRQYDAQWAQMCSNNPQMDKDAAIFFPEWVAMVSANTTQKALTWGFLCQKHGYTPPQTQQQSSQTPQAPLAGQPASQTQRQQSQTQQILQPSQMQQTSQSQQPPQSNEATWELAPDSMNWFLMAGYTPWQHASSATQTQQTWQDWDFGGWTVPPK